MVPNRILRHHTLQVRHVCVVSEGKDSRIGDFGRQQGLRPWSDGILRRPCLLAVSGETMYEDDARLRSSLASSSYRSRLLACRFEDDNLLDYATLSIMQQLDS